MLLILVKFARKEQIILLYHADFILLSPAQLRNPSPRTHLGQLNKPVPKLSILNTFIGTFPLTGVYSRKALLGNFPPVIGKGFL